MIKKISVLIVIAFSSQSLFAQTVINRDKTIEQMGEAILEYCIKAASGEVIPKAVQLNQDDFIPWKRGVSL